MLFRSLVDAPPQWLNEGVAEMIEEAALGDDGAFLPRVHAAWARQYRERVHTSTPPRGHYRHIDLETLLRMRKADWLAQQGAAYPQAGALTRCSSRRAGGAPQR